MEGTPTPKDLNETQKAQPFPDPEAFAIQRGHLARRCIGGAQQLDDLAINYRSIGSRDSMRQVGNIAKLEQDLLKMLSDEEVNELAQQLENELLSVTADQDNQAPPTPQASEAQEKDIPRTPGSYKPGVNPFSGLPFNMTDEEIEERMKDPKVSENSMAQDAAEYLDGLANGAIYKVGMKIPKGKQFSEVNAHGFVRIAHKLAVDTSSDREWHAAMMLVMGQLQDMDEKGMINFNDTGMNPNIKNDGLNGWAEKLYKGKSNNIQHTTAYLDENALIVLKKGGAKQKELNDQKKRSIGIPFTGIRIGMPVNKGDIRAWDFAAKITRSLEKDGRIAAVKLMEKEMLQ